MEGIRTFPDAGIRMSDPDGWRPVRLFREGAEDAERTTERPEQEARQGRTAEAWNPPLAATGGSGEGGCNAG